ncbi:MAG TPA: PilI type IV pilus biogenesis protein [Anaerolineae bacterium]|nr:PilI type IV pilus biogenesis protein [Anaerolineae bacterium]
MYCSESRILVRRKRRPGSRCRGHGYFR